RTPSPASRRKARKAAAPRALNLALSRAGELGHAGEAGSERSLDSSGPSEGGVEQEAEQGAEQRARREAEEKARREAEERKARQETEREREQLADREAEQQGETHLEDEEGQSEDGGMETEDVEELVAVESDIIQDDEPDAVASECATFAKPSDHVVSPFSSSVHSSCSELVPSAPPPLPSAPPPVPSAPASPVAAAASHSLSRALSQASWFSQRVWLTEKELRAADQCPLAALLPHLAVLLARDEQANPAGPRPALPPRRGPDPEWCLCSRELAGECQDPGCKAQMRRDWAGEAPGSRVPEETKRALAQALLVPVYELRWAAPLGDHRAGPPVEHVCAETASESELISAQGMRLNRPFSTAVLQAAGGLEWWDAPKGVPWPLVPGMRLGCSDAHEGLAPQVCEAERALRRRALAVAAPQKQLERYFWQPVKRRRSKQPKEGQGGKGVPQGEKKGEPDAEIKAKGGDRGTAGAVLGSPPTNLGPSAADAATTAASAYFEARVAADPEDAASWLRYALWLLGVRHVSAGRSRLQSHDERARGSSLPAAGPALFPPPPFSSSWRPRRVPREQMDLALDVLKRGV
ncbi:hypothetical protein H632_c2554p0, partial [Helicosporidium sp. ATCC 50920]